MASLVAQTIKCLPAMWETRVRFLGPEDSLEKKMATHSSTLAWKIPWTEEPDKLYIVHGVAKSRTRLRDFTFTFLWINKKLDLGFQGDCTSTIGHRLARVCSVTKSWPTLCNPMDCSPRGSSVHGVVQARILEWGAISSSRGSSRLRDRTHVF